MKLFFTDRTFISGSNCWQYHINSHFSHTHTRICTHATHNSRTPNCLHPSEFPPAHPPFTQRALYSPGRQTASQQTRSTSDSTLSLLRYSRRRLSEGKTLKRRNWGGRRHHQSPDVQPRASILRYDSSLGNSARASAMPSDMVCRMKVMATL